MSNGNNKKDIIKDGKEIGVDKYKILLDPEACDSCSATYGFSLDGVGGAEGFTGEELKKVKGPPLHKGCRCIPQVAIESSNINEMAKHIVAQAKVAKNNRRSQLKTVKFLRDTKKVLKGIDKTIKFFSKIGKK